jgi:hypothetical protein
MNAYTRACALILSCTLFAGAQDSLVLDDTMKPLYFETLAYPLTARITHTQGVVVIRAKLDDDGKVVSATAISGAKDLISDSLSNSKQWLFQPNANKSVILVYQFKIEGLCKLPCPSHFTFSPPNLATITIGNPIVDHTAKE